MPEAPDHDLERELVDLETRSWEAWKARDGDYFEWFLSDDHVEIGVAGVADKRAVVATVRSTACVVRDYTVSDFHAQLLGPDVAVLTYHAAQDTRCGGVAVPSPVWVSSLYVRRDGRWVNAVYQQTAELPRTSLRA